MNSELVIKKDENPYKLALLSDRVSDMPKGKALAEIYDTFSNMYLDSGQAIPEKEYQRLLADRWYKEILTDFKFLRVEEMKLAFKNGLRGEYGEYFGLNIKSFNQWIKGFIAEEKRHEALQRLKEENAPPLKPLVSPTEAEYLWKQAMIKQFEDFKATGVLKCEFPNYQFTEFEKRGLIKLNKTEKEFIWEQAKEKVIELHKLKRLNPKSIKERDISTKRINEIMCDQMSVETKSEVQNTARRTGIELYYRTVEKFEL